MTDSETPSTSTRPTIVNVEVPRMGLGVFANSLESFSGKENVKEFFERVEQRAELDNISDNQLLKVIKCKLVGNAYQYFKSETSLNSPSTSYQQLKSALVDRFTPLRIPGAAQFKLTQIYQRANESVGQFVTRLKLTGQEALEEDLATASEAQQPGIVKKNADAVLAQFKLGLKREILRVIGILLMRESSLTIEQASTIAEQEELNQAVLNSTRFSAHGLEYREDAWNQPQASKFQVRTPTIDAVKCFNCLKSGHLAKNCKNKTVCRHCAKPGHRERDCFAKKKANDVKSAGNQHTQENFEVRKNRNTERGSGNSNRTSNNTPRFEGRRN